MNQTFVRCPHCGLPHEHDQRVCPSTGLALPRARERPAIPAGPVIPRSSGGAAPADDEHGPARRQIIGRVIGDKYGVTGLIGEGGMGAVYEAEHLAIGRLVAVKVLHPKHAQKREAVSRLHHEARVVGTIGHPNICEVYDIGRLDDGSPYLVMERLHGETLAEKIQREGSVAYPELIDIVVQVLSALVAAHDKGVVHRDLKPENIFLSERAGMPPVAKLLDFGISKAANLDDTAVNLTRTGMVMGTPYYMAPEQARGDRMLDHRVDLWAVGVVLYEGLSGRRPFVARNYNALLVQILTSRHRPLVECKPDVPVGLSQLVDKALSKMREDRFQSAAEFQEFLLRYKRPSTAPMLPAMTAAEGVRWGRRASDRMEHGSSGTIVAVRPDPAALRASRGADDLASARPGPVARPEASARTGARPPEPPRSQADSDRGFHEEATIVLKERLPPPSHAPPPEATDDDTPIYPPPAMPEEDPEATVVDPPSFLNDSVTIGGQRKPWETK